MKTWSVSVNYKTQLEEFVERECVKQYGHKVVSNKQKKQGAHLLLPMLVEAMDALEFYKKQGEFTPYEAPSTDFTVYDYGETACVTLRSINEKLVVDSE
jgi:hypothetical protein